ncbi:MAG: hypothetical protein QM765_41005 [Myxococcales bacterium]
MDRARGLAALVGTVLLISAVALGDGPPKAAAPAEESGLDCGKLMACSDECGLKCSGISKFGCLLDCKNTCSKRGCPKASEAFEAVAGCMKSHCPFACAGGPTEKCRKCGVEDCPDERKACEAQRCEDGAGPPPAAKTGAPDAGAADAGR